MPYVVIEKEDGGFEFMPGVQPEMSEEQGLTQYYSDILAQRAGAYGVNLKNTVAREQHVADLLVRSTEWMGKKLYDWDHTLQSQYAQHNSALNRITEQILANMAGAANVTLMTASEKLMESAGAIASENIEKSIASQINADAIAATVAERVNSNVNAEAIAGMLAAKVASYLKPE